MKTTEIAAQTREQGLLEKIDIPSFIAGLIAGFLALSNEPWWTLTGPAGSNILSIVVSPFYLEIYASGVPVTTPVASILGAFTRIIVILCSIGLVACSVRPTAWWRPLATWLGLASLVEIFFSFFLFIHSAQTALLTLYGASPPISGTALYPARVVGTDLYAYQFPFLTATFNIDFFLGLGSLTIIGTSTVLKLLQHQGLVSSLLPGVKELFISPPYRQVWLSTSNQNLNPLEHDPETASDAQLLESFENIYNTVQPGGTINIILPAWATSVSDRFQKLLTWTGFSIEESGPVYRSPSKPETQLKLKKPQTKRETEPVETAPPTAVLSQEIDTSPLPDTPPQLSLAVSPDWTPVKMTRRERIMLKTAIAILSKQAEPVVYRDLLNQVYMELVEKKVPFDSARQIETILLGHNGRELALIEESDPQGFKTAKKWALGEDKLSPDSKSSTIIGKITSRRPNVPSVTRLLKKWQRKPRYSSKSSGDDDSP